MRCVDVGEKGGCVCECHPESGTTPLGQGLDRLPCAPRKKAKENLDYLALGCAPACLGCRGGGWPKRIGFVASTWFLHVVVVVVVVWWLLCEWPELTTPGTGCVSACVLQSPAWPAWGYRGPYILCSQAINSSGPWLAMPSRMGNTMSQSACWCDITRHARKQYR